MGCGGMIKTSIYTKTPEITVIDNRDLQVRSLQYNRRELEDPIKEYITVNTYTNLGQFKDSMDPRLFLKCKEDKSILPNINNKTSLRGEVLHSESLDAGSQLSFFDIEGKVLWSRNANTVQTKIEYDLI